MKRLWITIGLIAVVSVLALIALIPNAGNPTEPEYHGRKLTAWLDDLTAPSPAMPANAKLAIQQMGTNAVPFLVQMLHAKDSSFRRRYMALLERQHWVDFRFRYDFQKQREALQGLIILGPDAKAAIPDVAALLKAGNAGIGLEAAFTLSRIGPAATPALQSALTSTNKWTRQYALQFLGAMGEPSSLSNLLAALRDPDRMIRVRAAMALHRFPEQAKVIVPALTNCLDDPDHIVQGGVARTLGTFGADAMPAFPILLKMVATSNDQVSEAATRALMQIDFDATLAAFTNNLESPDVNVRRTTAWALRLFKSDGEPAVLRLVKCLRDPDVKVRENAAVALREIAADPDLVVPALIENLNDPDPEVREVSAVSLGSFGARAKPAVPQILKIFDENKGNELSAEGLYNALSAIDPAAAAKLNGQ